jgi:glycosyltransferase involved in cell wall biosynthesis
MRRLRGGLIGAIVAQRHGVLCLAPDYAPSDATALDAAGVRRQQLAPPPPGLMLFPERIAITRLTEQLAEWRPHAVLAYGQDMALRAVKAARSAKVERIVAMVTGLPLAGESRGLKTIARTLELADSAVFHNGEDPKFLRARKLLPADLSYVVVPGAGVDLAHYASQPLPPLNDGLVFLMIARQDKATGVLDYCDAARLVKARAPSARFHLAGLPGSGKGAVTAAMLEPYRECVRVLGPLEDVRSALGACHVYVYPSHGESMPRSVLEAMATGRPIITTATPGCRDTVDERVNGCLVPPSNPQALAAAMETFLKRPDLIPPIARASRTKAERRFDEVPVHAALMEVLGLT